MKKALSLILAIMMVFALSTTAFATRVDVVGTVIGSTEGTHKGTVADGVTEIPTDANASTNIAIKATTGNVEHRYAVDINYQDMNLQITGGNLVWNVNSLEYENKEGSTAVYDQDFDITVTNYSDMPVQVDAAITVDSTKTPAELKFNLSAGTELDNTATALTYSKKMDPATIGKAATTSFNMTAWSTNWPAVSNYYLKNLAAGEEAIIATLKITISTPTT